MKITIEDGDKVEEYDNVEDYFLFGFLKKDNIIYDFEQWHGKNKYLYQSLCYYKKIIEHELFSKETNDINLQIKQAVEQSIQDSVSDRP